MDILLGEKRRDLSEGRKITDSQEASKQHDVLSWVNVLLKQQVQLM